MIGPRLLGTVWCLLAVLGGAGAAAGQSGDVQRGRALYVQDCVSCHGPDARGVPPGTTGRGARGISGTGPSLRGVGAASAHFYLSTGYMPLATSEQQPRRHDPAYSDDELDALVAYIASFGGRRIPEPHPERGSVSRGLSLFTENCAGCHQMLGEGGALPGGVALPLERSTAVQIAEAVRVGPYLMPRFPESPLDARELDSLIRYVQYAQHPRDEGGWAIGHLGPIPEGLVAWLIAGLALVLVAVLIGERTQREE